MDSVGFVKFFGDSSKEVWDGLLKELKQKLLEKLEDLRSCTPSDRQSVLKERNELEYYVSKLEGKPEMRLGMVLGQKPPELAFENKRSRCRPMSRRNFVPKSVRRWRTFSAEAKEYDFESFVSAAEPISPQLRKLLAATTVDNHDGA